MKQYLELCQSILDNGEWKEPARENMPRTLSLFGTRMEFDVRKGFPLLTTKKMYYKAIITELLWFIKGDTNIKYLVDNGCNIWNSDSYKYYLTFAEKNQGYGLNTILHENEDGSFRIYHMDEFINAIKNNNLGEFKYNYFKDNIYKLGDLGNVYGHNWRNQNGVDQLKVCVNNLLDNPMGRYPIIDAWNPSDWGKSALMPCHLLYQFNCGNIAIGDRLLYLEQNNKKTGYNNPGYELGRSDGYYTTYSNDRGVPTYYLDLQLYQRSCDTFLGNGFNITSASIFLHLMGKLLNMVPRKFVWVGGDTHIYENHIDQVKLQLTREPLQLPKLTILKELKTFDDLINLEIGDIIIEDYISHPTIKGELKTGL